MPDLYDFSNLGANWGAPGAPSASGMSFANPGALSIGDISPSSLSGFGANPGTVADLYAGLPSAGGSSGNNWGGLFGMGSAGTGGQPGFGFNIPTAQMGLGALGSIGQLIAAFGSLGVANKQLSMTRQIANANLANQIQSYNTNLSDRERVRGAWEGLTPQQVSSYVTANSLKPVHIGG